MNIQDLSSDIKAGKIRELNLVSMEGGSYVLHALVADKSVPVEDSHGKPLHIASVEEARKVLSSVPDVRLFLSQGVVHDEMVGLDDTQAESSRHEIPLRSSL
ncbi:cation transporter [Pseudomonas floridensis]|uniref:Cation transporter n=1 Tax=Pseudomonas floridensis TaxID=1958950 RepID=A0A1X0NA41_9PSED|nr:cation transporter [Pseudomonas floridensis]